ncbi:MULTISPECIES: LysR family transcriptional regulator [unclassified Methylobacterium]|nr:MULTISPECIES: LysR family transcriptional regulator [unclassified Methylobacterium]KQP07960.1 LysR family transcriptional regulator [Methylobacterium sp. Leaf99]KQP40363.1 LysR family transcriptional regulator [Methylobacterium sp. Leaf106]TXN27658.1 LysR family transcriptional regulator [Methylobacterium sp. WL19]
MSSGNIGDIAAFVAAAEAGSFVAAARIRAMTRSGIAKSVGRLEGRLGVRLFHRTTRSLALTDDGRIFLDRCTQILSDLEDAELSMANGSGEPQGLLRLTAPATFGRVVILPVLNRFLASWPKLRAEVSLTDRVNDIIDDGYDLAIRIGEPREHGSLIARTLTRQQDVVVASPGYLSTRPPPLHPDDLTDHACLSYLSAGQHRGWRFAIDGRTASIRPRARLSLDGGEALRDAAISGAGLAYLPSYVVDDDVANDRLRTVLSAYAAPPVPICALYPSRRHLASKVRRFIDLVAAEL